MSPATTRNIDGGAASRIMMLPAGTSRRMVLTVKRERTSAGSDLRLLRLSASRAARSK